MMIAECVCLSGSASNWLNCLLKVLQVNVSILAQPFLPWKQTHMCTICNPNSHICMYKCVFNFIN